jgi:hypothetical protein
MEALPELKLSIRTVVEPPPPKPEGTALPQEEGATVAAEIEGAALLAGLLASGYGPEEAVGAALDAGVPPDRLVEAVEACPELSEDDRFNLSEFIHTQHLQRRHHLREAALGRVPATDLSEAILDAKESAEEEDAYLWLREDGDVELWASEAASRAADQQALARWKADRATQDALRASGRLNRGG